jgi:hypothetical protein
VRRPGRDNRDPRPRVRSSPARGRPSWASRRSSPSRRATPTRPRAEAGRLDFLTLSDYVSGSAWGEIGRYEPLYPNNLIIPSAEVITYRGHTNNHGSLHFVDYREGPLFVRKPADGFQLVRGTRDPRDLFAEAHRFGGWTRVNHPTIFPPVSPAAAALCRGCFWEYSDDETDRSRVDAFEVATGPGDIAGTTQNPFTITAIERYEQLLAQGYQDRGGRIERLTRGRQGGRSARRADRRAAHGRARQAAVDARHPLRRPPAPHVREGARRERARFIQGGAGHWRLQGDEGSLIQAVSSPIWVEPGNGNVVRASCR